MTVIDGPVPNRKDLVWDSSDINSDFIPMQERSDKPDNLWWCIDITENTSQELYDEIAQWCMDNAAYQCGTRYNDKWHNYYILAFFRHPDDAMAFKLRWT